jgi:HPt (histidine-containing phosphotransfer) domain-containing protein
VDSEGDALEMDLDALCDELELDREQFAQFASLFIEVALADLARIREAYARGDTAGVAESAHSIKGAAATLELETIFGLARALEIHARAGEGQAVHDTLDWLGKEIDQLRVLLEEQGLAETRTPVG